MERLIIFSLLLGVAHSWSITSQFPRRSLAENRATTRVYMGSKVKKGAQTKKRSGGFGKVEEKKKEVIGTGAKAQREQYESFANLANVFRCGQHTTSVSFFWLTGFCSNNK